MLDVEEIVRGLVSIILLLWFCGFGMAQSSVLSEGTWFKVGITESGMYKLDRGTLDALGVGVISDPQQIQLFGNGVKGVLPQENEINRPVDLIENAILVSGEGDGSFDQNDYILFYGVGPHEEEWSADGFSFRRNIYSDTAYYFLKIGSETGKRVQANPSLQVEAATAVSSFDDHIVFEEDNRNLISSGREWYGDALSNGDRYQQSIFIDGLSSNIQGFFAGVSQSPEVAEMKVEADGASVGTLSLATIRTGASAVYSIKARSASGNFVLPQNADFDLTVTYESAGENARGYLDRYYLTFERDLKLYANETDFRIQGHSGTVVEYEVEGIGEGVIWNVTDPANYFEQEHILDDSKAKFRSQSSNLEEFVVFTGNDFPSPFVFGQVRNQNLRADINYEGVIVAAAPFLPEAQRLADFHRNNDGLTVKVVTPVQVYNEFSSGRQDVTAIRDYAKYVYENGGNLRYLLLFGDCSYEYKYRVSGNSNFVPTYQSRDSFSPIFSHSSDDYFGFFEENEGAWVEDSFGDHTMEIGVGRLPVKSLQEARIVVDKVIYYATSPNTLGKWKNEVTYLADDGDGNIHSRHVEDLSEIIDTTYAQYEINKLLLDAFDQVSDGAIERSPTINQSLKTQIKEGTFLLNFIGHGNERLWTAEQILTVSDIDEMNNRNKLPIFVTATCEFGRYDDPFQVSGAEQLLLSQKGGAIALLTTSRPVFASTNFELNQAFHENVFRRVDGAPQRLGDIIRSTKNDGLAGPVNRNFTLLGDPMLLPSFPKLDIQLMNFNLDTLSALEEVTIDGEIREAGLKNTDFNGQLEITIFDTEQRFRTKGQESTPYTYTLRSNAIFRGEAEVIDGEFSFSFVVPKNISYQFDQGKISLYASDVENNLDAAGSSRSFVIGGTAQDAVDDNEPPSISMFMNNEAFVNGGVVGKNALFIANLADDSGITTASSGVVSGIELELNGESINLNEFYTASTNDFSEGTVVYPIQDLEAGRYTARLTVWDTHNNSSSSSLEFSVSDENEFFIYNDLAYPNPVRSNEGTTFRFEHDREDEDVTVSLLVYNGRGTVVAKKKYLFENSSRVIEIPWSVESDGGLRVNESLYYYRLIIQSNFDGATKEIVRKLVVID